MSDVLSKLIDEIKHEGHKKISNIIILGLLEDNTQLSDKGPKYGQFKKALKQFSKDKKERLPILKIESNAKANSNHIIMPRSQLGKYEMIGSDGLPRTRGTSDKVLDGVSALARGEEVEEAPMPRAMKVYLHRRFEMVNFLKKYYTISEITKFSCKKTINKIAKKPKKRTKSRDK